MDGINMSSPNLPPGFRFHPTDQELIIHYLKKKVSSPSLNPEVSIIADVNIYNFNPRELPGKAFFGEGEWFFFSPRDRKYPNGVRPNRAAASGYWKATGTDKPILTSSGSQCLGVKKALVFYKGRPPKGIKTNWMMQEYRLLDDNHHLHRLKGSMRLDDWVLCRVHRKSNTPQHKEEPYDSSCGSSSPFTLGCLQGQEIMNKNSTFRDYDYDFEGCLIAPLESKEMAEQGQGHLEFQEGSPGYSVSAMDSGSPVYSVSAMDSGSPGYSVSAMDFGSPGYPGPAMASGSPGYPVSAMDSNPQLPMIPTFTEALESIKKVLSVGTLEELVPVPSEKRLHVSISNDAENECIFQVSPPTISASYPQTF